MTERQRHPGSEPMILLAAGQRDDDPAVIWTALLEAAPAVRVPDPVADPEPASTGSPITGPATPATSAAGPVAWAVTGIDATVARMRSVLAHGRERLLVVPVGVLDDPDGPSGPLGPPAWQAPLADAVDGLRAAYPAAQIHDLGRPVGGPTAAALAGLVAVPHNGSPSMLAGAIARGFSGDPAGLARCIARLRTALPVSTTIALRGSAVVGDRHADGAPFDADGPGTSDLDVVAVGETAIELWVPDARLLGGINTLPLSDEATWAAPALDRARRQAQEVVRRPLSIQAMAGWFLDLRAVVQRQPYVVLSAPS